MNVLFLGPPDSPVLDFLKSTETDVVQTMDPLDAAFFDRHPVDFLVSHGYRHILKPYVLDRFSRRAVNLHISYLPWNRGADPNLWSVIENTPKGVSIHYLDAGIDTGDLIAQTTVEFRAGDTLRTSYERLQREIANLFTEHWPRIRAGTCDRRRQSGAGSFHRVADREKVVHLLTSGWDTRTGDLERTGADWCRSQRVDPSSGEVDAT
ncbi:MAG TPA: formyltransferase family protein [Planctomycetaceae bacterium]|jgi:methionyl-tRNA formyltransferase|nr:formyltransferase family protein [Planctomycetaceae bacterium]